MAAISLVSVPFFDKIADVPFDVLAAASVKSRNAMDAELFEVGLIRDIGNLNGIHPIHGIGYQLRVS